MRTIPLKISSSGQLLLAHPLAKAGAEHLIYAITGVPFGVPVLSVVLQANKICFAHSLDDEGAWTYAWDDIKNLPQGAIINRYRRDAKIQPCKPTSTLQPAI